MILEIEAHVSPVAEITFMFYLIVLKWVCVSLQSRDHHLNAMSTKN